MYYSLELRWFFDNKPLDETCFFSQGTAPKTRTDFYAYPCDERSGVKTREGRIETKLRMSEKGLYEHGLIKGRLEEWKKWSVAFDEEDMPEEESLVYAGWVGVKKTRYLRIFEIEQEEVREVLENSKPLINGVQFELTKLTIHEKEYWTVSFEAFGEGDLKQSLQKVLDHVFSSTFGYKNFTLENSYGYPKWLQKV